MQQRNIGNSGLRVAAVGLGGNNFGGRLKAVEGRAVVHKALDMGVTFFDSANFMIAVAMGWTVFLSIE